MPVLPNLEIIIGLIFVIAQYFIFLYSLYFLFLIKAEKEMDFSTFFKNIFTSMLKGFFLFILFNSIIFRNINNNQIHMTILKLILCIIILPDSTNKCN